MTDSTVETAQTDSTNFVQTEVAATGDKMSPDPQQSQQAATPPPPVPPSPVPAINDTSRDSYKAFVESLPDDVKSYASKYKDFVELAKGTAEASVLLSKRPDQYSQEDWKKSMDYDAQFRDIPVEPKGYAYKVIPNDYIDSDYMNDDFRNVWAEFSHSIHLTKEQSNEIYNFNNRVTGLANKQVEELNTLVDQQNAARLEQMWGNNAPLKKTAANYAITDILPKMTGLSSDEINNFVNAWIKTNDVEIRAAIPAFMQTLASLGSMGGQGMRTSPQQLSPVDANIRLNELKKDAKFKSALGNPNDPNHKMKVEELRILNQKKYA